MSSNVSATIYGPSGEQLTQSTPLVQKIQDLAGGFSNGVPGYVTSTSVVGTGVAQSTLTPFGTALEGSIYFPSSASSYLSAKNPTFDLNFKSTSMTLEGWFYFTSFANGGTNAVFSHANPVGGVNDWSLQVTSGGQWSFYYYNGSAGNYVYGPTIALNTWYHLCVQNDASLVYMFTNGALSNTAAFSGTPAITSGVPLTFGVANGYNGPQFYVSSPRLTFSANLYSQGSFTAPTGPLGPAPTGQTVMLLRNPLYSSMTLRNPLNAQSSVRVRCLPADALIYLDAFGSNVPNKAPLSNAPTFDPYGTGAVNFRTAQSQYLDFGPQTWNIGTKGFTAVVKFQWAGSTVTGYEAIWSLTANQTAGNNANLIALNRNATAGQLTFGIYNASATAVTSFTTGTIYQDIPYVIVCVYDPLASGGQASIYVNGTLISTSATGLAGSVLDRVNQQCYINQLYGSGVAYNSNQNIYTLAFYNRALTTKEIQDASAMLSQVAPVVPSTVEIGNVNGRPALTVDPTGAVNVLGPLNGQAGGYAPVDLGVSALSLASGNLTSNISVTSFSPLGPGEGSMYFPGVANTYISFGTTGQPFSNSNIYAFGDFVVEAWVNPTSLANNPVLIEYGDVTGTTYWVFQLSSGGALIWYSLLNGVASSVTTTSGVISTSTWFHISVIHQSSTKRLQFYVNGVPQTFSATAGGFSSSGSVASYTTGIIPATGFSTIIGQYTSASPLTGYLTNLRIVTGSGAAQIYNNNAFVPSLSPLFPASNTAGGSLTTRLLVRVPQTPGKVQTQKLIGAAATGYSGVQAFPPVPMTNSTVDMTGQAPYGQGKYVATTSTTYDSTYFNWWPFSASSTWTSVGSVYSPSGYTGAVRTVDVNGNSYPGEWFQIQMPVPIVPSSYQFSSNAGAGTAPATFWLMGSNDGINWYVLDFRFTPSQASVGWNSTNIFTGSVNTNRSYSIFRVVCGSVMTPASYSYVQIGGFARALINGTIEGLNLTSDGRLGVGVVNPTRALEVAGDVVCGGTLSAGNPLMFRNRIINGDFRIDQRGSASTPVTSGYSADRWVFYKNGSFTATLGQVSTPVQLNGFQYALKLNITSGASLSAGDYINLGQVIEGFNLADLMWGTPSASPITISFWIYSSITGTFSVALRNSAQNRAFVVNVTINGANAWQYVSINVPGDATGTWVVNNGIGLFTTFTFACGSTNQTSTTGSWATGGSLGTSSTTNFAATTGNAVYITGVQLEKGTVATPFEVRPFGTELALCQRYYVRFTGDGSYKPIGVATAISTTAATGIIVAPTSMRTQVQTIDISSSSNTCGYTSSMIQGTTTYTTNDVYLYSAGTNFGFTTIGGTGNGMASLSWNLIGINLTNGSGITAGWSGMYYIPQGKYIGFSAEL